MTLTDWYAAVIARPECPAVRAGFLDWLQETYPIATADPWFGHYARHPGPWRIDCWRKAEPVLMRHAADAFPAIGVRITGAARLGRDTRCQWCESGSRRGTRIYRESVGWLCEPCHGQEVSPYLYIRRSYPDGLHIYDDIPF